MKMCPVLRCSCSLLLVVYAKLNGSFASAAFSFSEPDRKRKAVLSKPSARGHIHLSRSHTRALARPRKIPPVCPLILSPFLPLPSPLCLRPTSPPTITFIHPLTHSVPLPRFHPLRFLITSAGLKKLSVLPLIPRAFLGVLFLHDPWSLDSVATVVVASAPDSVLRPGMIAESAGPSNVIAGAHF